MRFLTIVIFCAVWIYADEIRVASHPCELFNNLKHTKNSGSKRLAEGVSYRVLREQSGHYYIQVPSLSIPNRWVEKSCFRERVSEPNQQKEFLDVAKISKDGALVPHKKSLLALSWHNAFCETHRSRRECRPSLGVYRNDSLFVLHGLWPQPRERLYCDVPYTFKQYDKNKQWNRLPPPDLSEETKRALAKVMPGVTSHLDRHEWIKHGSCYGGNAESYFGKALSFTLQVNRSKLGNFFVTNMGNVVTIEQIRFKVDESFGKGSGKRVEMLCQNGMIAELWFHLYGESEDLSASLKNAKSVHSRCSQGKIDRAGF